MLHMFFENFHKKSYDLFFAAESYTHYVLKMK